MMHAELFVVRSFWILATLLTPASANADAKRLYDDLLMKGYDSNVRPATKRGDSTIINFGIRLSQIVAVDEVNQIMTANLWAEQVWMDPRLKWDVHQYNNISMLFVPADKVWRPDIVLYNNADGEYTITSMGKAVIYPDGKVMYNPPVQFKSSCEINMEYFPFDEQLCNMKFGPWTHDSSKVDVLHLFHRKDNWENREVIQDGVILEEYQQSVEWDLMKATAQENLVAYPCCPGQYFADVTFYITLRRKHLYYVINLVIPCMSMNILTILAFYLPSSSGEKIGITISAFLSLSLFQLVLFDLTPSSSLKLPLIGKYIMLTSLLVTLSVMANTIILNLNHRMSSTHKMSRIVRWLFLKLLPRLLRMSSPEQDENTSPLEENMLSYAAYYNREHEFRNTFLGQWGIMGLQNHEALVDFNLDKICRACELRRLGKYPPAVQKGFDGLCFIAKHYRDDYQGKHVKDEWRYVALVFDRVLLVIYIIVTLGITLEIFLNAPALYDHKKPIEHG